MIRIALIDDQEMIRVGLRTILDAHPELTVVAEGADGYAALRIVETTEVDVMLLDIQMLGIDGIETIRRLRRTHPSERLRILVLTTFDQDENVLNALKAGADGFLGKAAGPAELAAGVLDVFAGGNALSTAAVSALIEHVTEERGVVRDPEMVARFALLTPRELEVVTAVVSGLDNKQIAAVMVVSPFTVKTHANRAMTKVGARDRAQLVSFAVRAGMRP